MVIPGPRNFRQQDLAEYVKSMVSAPDRGQRLPTATALFSRVGTGVKFLKVVPNIPLVDLRYLLLRCLSL